VTIDARLQQVVSKPPLVFDEIDFTIRDRRGLRRSLAAPLEYAQRVEGAVVRSGIEMLMPRRTPAIDEFLEVWTVDEHAHARALAELMRQLDLQPGGIGVAGTPIQNRAIGLVASAFESLHDVVTTIWGIAGAMNEHLAMAAYTRMGAILQARGERALHETLMRRLRAHESVHKSFYATVAIDGWDRLGPWQRRTVRTIVTNTWAPVGAGSPCDRPAMARTMHALAVDDWVEHLIDPVQRVADHLLHTPEPPGDFVYDAFAKCLRSDPRGRRMIAAREAVDAVGAVAQPGT
jgi:hypothetical protein